MTKRLMGTVEKGWGYEDIFVTNDLYCGKFLNFNENSQCSMHFHSTKDETWYVMSGEFIVYWIDTDNAKSNNTTLTAGMTWRNFPLIPHQLKCIKAGVILEISTPDSVDDNYRISGGDSQK